MCSIGCLSYQQLNFPTGLSTLADWSKPYTPRFAAGFSAGVEGLARSHRVGVNNVVQQHLDVIWAAGMLKYWLLSTCCQLLLWGIP
jgi:hypothetical protein